MECLTPGRGTRSHQWDDCLGPHSDLTFRTARILGLPFAPDNIIVDHRKISFRDVTELDPSKGEGVYAGVGIGEHYASATWEDRAMLAAGRALVTLKDAGIEEPKFSDLHSVGVAAAIRPAPHRFRPRAADLRRRGHVERALAGRLRLSQLSSGRTQL